MIPIQASTRQKYMEGQGTKKLSLFFPGIGLTITNEHILTESMQLKESLCDKTSIEWVGCVSSVFQIELKEITTNLKDKEIIVTMDIDDDNQPCLIFRGYVDSVTNSLADHYKKIVCYDSLYHKTSQLDIASTYNDAEFPLSLRDVRANVFSACGIQQETVNLPSDYSTVEKIFEPKQLKALDVIKHLCQINGVFGYYGRDGIMHYKSIGSNPVAQILYYQKITYEDYEIDAVDKVMIKDKSSDEGVSYGSGTNTYTIQGNIWAYKMPDNEKQDICQYISEKLGDTTYQPFEATVPGVPFIEVGDRIIMTVKDHITGQAVPKEFVVMQRTLKGIQHLTDTFVASGDKTLHTFVSEIGTSLDLIAEAEESALSDKVDEVSDSVSDLSDRVDQTDTDMHDIDDRVSVLENSSIIPENLVIASVRYVPSLPANNTLYLIQGELVVIQ